MLFPTLAFGVFFLFVYFTAWSLDRENGRRKLFLLLASWFFYAQWDWRFVALLIASAVLNWGVAALIARRARGGERKWPGWSLGVAVNLLILGFFKYYGFFVEQAGRPADPVRLGARPAAAADRAAGRHQLLHLPGHQLCRRRPSRQDAAGQEPARRHAADELLPASGGRADRAGLGPAAAVRPDAAADAGDGDPRPAADRLGPVQEDGDRLRDCRCNLVDPVFFDPSAYGALDIAAAVYGYAVQIYCDFSAYSDMAIGIAALLGYSFPRNFDQPYRASLDAGLLAALAHQPVQLAARLSLCAAGRRPEGADRGQLPQRLHHHAAGRAVARGGLDLPGLGRAAWRGAGDRAAGPARPSGDRKVMPTVVGVLVTFHIVCLGWILFRAENFDMAMADASGAGPDRTGGGADAACC